jgi:hypothetical protein
MSNLVKRLDAHFIACAAAAGAAVVGTAQTAEAGIVWSGAVNLPIALTTNGLYLNVVNGAINEPGNTTGGSVPGWDINPYGSTSLIMFNAVAPANPTYVMGNIAPGTPISGASVFGSGTVTNGAPYNLNSSNNLFGFRFVNESAGNQLQYGWFRVALGASTSTAGRAVVEYAYENTGQPINAGAVPAPGSLALLALGAVGLTGRRRK